MEGKIFVEERQVVIPGEKLASGLDFVPSFGTYRDGKEIYATRIGLVNIHKNIIKIISLNGVYMPKEGDLIIGRISDFSSKGWMVDINSAYHAMLMVKEFTRDYVSRDANLSRYLDINDYIVAKVSRVSPQMLIDLTMMERDLKKLEDGRIIKFNPFKTPRVIGKQGSMISMIKKHLKLNVVIGQNGIIWTEGNPEDEILFLKVLDMIDQQSHTSGLTQRVEEFIVSELKKRK